MSGPCCLCSSSQWELNTSPFSAFHYDFLFNWPVENGGPYLTRQNPCSDLKNPYTASISNIISHVSQLTNIITLSFKLHHIMFTALGLGLLPTQLWVAPLGCGILCELSDYFPVFGLCDW